MFSVLFFSQIFSMYNLRKIYFMYNLIYNII